MERVHYNVNGLVNNMSRTHVKNALDKLEGVQGVCVDVARGTIEVIYGEEGSESEIRDCIENTGFKIE